MLTLKQNIEQNIRHVQQLITEHYEIQLENHNLWLDVVIGKRSQRYKNAALVEIKLHDNINISVDDMIKASYFNQYMTAEAFGNTMVLLVMDCNSISQLEQVFNVVRRNMLLGRIDSYTISITKKTLRKLSLDVISTYTTSSPTIYNYFSKYKIFHMGNIEIVNGMLKYDQQKRSYKAPLINKMFTNT